MINSILAGNFDNVGKILESFLSQWWTPLLGVLGGASVILAFAAGIKLIMAAQSGDEQKLKQAKNFITYILIGIAVVFILAGLIPVIIAACKSWYDDNANQYAMLLISNII